MKRIVLLMVAAFLTMADPAQATTRIYPSCAEYSTFLAGRISSLDRRILTAPAAARPALIAIRSAYRNKLALVSTGQFGVIQVGGVPRCVRQQIDASGS